MRCSKFLKTLPIQISNQLGSKRKRLMMKHLKQCPSCLETYTEIYQIARMTTEASKQDSFKRINQIIIRELKEKIAQSRRPGIQAKTIHKKGDIKK